MLSRIKEYIEKNSLLDLNRRYLVALSGGADSVALLRTMIMLNYQVEAAHCNFHLRGIESDRDEEFVKDLCKKNNIELHLAHFDTRMYAETHHVSIEMAARQLRYDYFGKLLRDLELDAVCVAHHRDDNVETVLMNLIRGTGIRGLTGIHPRRMHKGVGSIIRPMLCVSRSEIENWLESIGQDYVTDSTNLKDDVVRNQIRLNVIPLLKQINPTVVENIQHTSELLIETERVYEDSIRSTINRLIIDNSIEIKELKNTSSPICLLFEWLSDYQFPPMVIQQIANHLDAQTGHFWQSPTHEICIDRGRLVLMERKDETTEMKLPETGLYVCPNGLKIRVSEQRGPTIVRTPDTACFDAEKVRFPLTLRTVQQGDRFIPFGMKGSRLVSDFLTDLKISLLEKRRQLIVTDAEGNIIWVVGRRPAALYSIQGNTHKTLLLQIGSNE